ncbi:YoaK family protein [Pseudomonas cremoricolorata]|uniref:Membrane protein n=1 Tax=Pseudomonas cremoricolorata TaxID=157783 RepID=A0A089WRN8_9PSED|nr:YoaK family protein [Pseudomonas cremoricolorata]AIR89849.1 membrane protein [Pseudomonas cremoricolorata]
MLPDRPHSATSPRARLRRINGRVGLGLVAALSFLAGMTDAVGFLATGDFVSFMSGNTTRLAVAVSVGDVSALARLALAIVCFVVGNALGVILARSLRRRAAPLLLLISASLALAALPGMWTPLAMALAIIAMGMLNAVVEQVNGLPIGLTYVTGALSRFGRGLGRWLMGERRSGWRVQLVPWAGMLLGAVLGAWLQARLGIAALVGCAGLTLVLACVTLFIPRAWQRGYMPR